MKEEPLSPTSPMMTTALFGHEEAERTFLKAWEEGTLHHAWMITGPRGIGKATLAWRIARFVLASTQEEQESRTNSLLGDGFAPDSLALSEGHPIFQALRAGSITDLVHLMPDVEAEKQTITVEQVRDVSTHLTYTTAAGGWRIILVDSLDDMNSNAANALLKWLEEPPARTLWLLVCHAPAAILPTLRSRCRALALHTPNAMALESAATSLGIHTASEEGQWAMRLCHGSPGRAFSLYQNKSYKEISSIIQSLQKDNNSKILDKWIAYYTAKEYPERWEHVLLFIAYWWHLALCLHTGSALPPDISAQEKAWITALTERYTPAELYAQKQQAQELMHQASSLHMDRTATLRALHHLLKTT